MYLILYNTMIYHPCHVNFSIAHLIVHLAGISAFAGTPVFCFFFPHSGTTSGSTLNFFKE
jgi:hypothetical protein